MEQNQNFVWGDVDLDGISQLSDTEKQPNNKFNLQISEIFWFGYSNLASKD